MFGGMYVFNVDKLFKIMLKVEGWIVKWDFGFWGVIVYVKLVVEDIKSSSL